MRNDKLITKINLSKKNSYTLLIISVIYISFLTLHMLWDFSETTQRAIAQGIKPGTDKMDEFIAITSKVWITQYISTSLLLLTFVGYSILSIEKIKIGKVFVFLWTIIWLGFAIAPILLLKRFSLFDAVSIVLFIAIIISMFLIFKQIEKYKISAKYQNMKNKNYKF